MSPCALYRHFDDLGTLLYVGTSVDPHARTGGHVAGSEWVRFARRGSVEWFPTTSAALIAEAFAIRTEGPVFNRLHSVGDPDERIAEYLRRRDEKPRQRTMRSVPVAPVEGLVTLAQAAPALGLDDERGLTSLRRARERHPRFPSPIGAASPGRARLYRLDELQAWNEQRRGRREGDAS